MRFSLIGFMALAIVAAAAAPGLAAKCVNVAGSGGCFDTIQGAVDAAAAGEAIFIAPGRYNENVDINTDGIKLIGTGAMPFQVAIDGDVSDCIDIDASNVVIKNLKLQNCDDSIYADTGDGLMVVNVLMVGANDDCLYIYGDNVTVKNSVCHNVGDYGFDVSGDNFSLLNSDVRNIEYYGVYVYGANALIKGNKVLNTYDDESIYIDGDDAVVRGNTVLGSYYELIYVDGDRAIVDGNLGQGSSDDYCMYLDGYENPVFTNNICKYSYENAFYVDCSGACATGKVVNNVGAFVSGDYYGFEVYTNGDAGFVVRGNFAHDTTDNGFYISGDNMTIAANEAFLCGADQDDGFYISTSNSTIINNYARRNNGYGFDISGSNNTITGNRALKNWDSGFDISGDANVLTANTAKWNQSYGIEVYGTGNELYRNVANGNSDVDFYDGGTGTVLGTGLQKNFFATTGP
jgi:parallel beta-helix repeat protein